MPRGPDAFAGAVADLSGLTCGGLALGMLTDAVDQAWLFDRWRTERLPTLDIELQTEIDCLWLSRGGPRGWRFERRSGAQAPATS